MNVFQTISELLLGKTIFDMNLNVGYYARIYIKYVLIRKIQF